jgi:hypothetical protein
VHGDSHLWHPDPIRAYPDGHEETQAPFKINPEAHEQTPLTGLVPDGQLLTQSPLER